jgi:hypothetical protein
VRCYFGSVWRNCPIDNKVIFKNIIEIIEYLNEEYKYENCANSRH